MRIPIGSATTLKEIAAGMREDPDFSAQMLSDLQLWGVDKVDGASVTIAGQVVCTDSGRWSVQREFNRRMKRRFEELGIQLYNPVRAHGRWMTAEIASGRCQSMKQAGCRRASQREGFAFARGRRDARFWFGPMADWPAFAASWDDLGLDTYMADGGRYRKRRHAAFGARAGEPIHRKPHQPHYQSRDYNPLNGGIARWFDPVLPEIAAGPSMTAILATCRGLFERLAPTRDWHIEVHQFRIEARSGEAGPPDPGGHAPRRRRLRAGAACRPAQHPKRRHIDPRRRMGGDLGSFTLAEPCDAAWVDDHRVLHGVTPVEPIEPAEPGFRDVLVVTFRREDA